MEFESTNNVRNRNSGIELLRISLMFLIVIHHLIVHGSYLVHVEDLPVNFATYQKLFFEAFVLFPVDCFVFISGFYGIKLNLKKTFSLWFQCVVYSISITCFFCIFYYGIRFIGFNGLVKSLFPITFSVWWFITCYFFLMLLSPALNLFIEKASKQMLQYVIIIGIVLNCGVSFITKSGCLGGSGSTLVNFIFIYFIGRYFKIHQEFITFSRVKLFLLYLLSCLTIAGISMLSEVYFSCKGIWHLYQFNNPIIIFEAICMFYFFKSFHFQSSYVNKIGSMVFAVYLIHDNSFVRNWLYARVLKIDNYSGGSYYLLYLLLFALIIFTVSILIELVREKLSYPILSIIYRMKYFAFIESKLKNIQLTGGNN